MKYYELKKILEVSSRKYICLFGAGLIGCTWAHDLLIAMGFHIDFYCDNNKKESLLIRDEIKTISLEKLYSLRDEVIVFITVGNKFQESIRSQLENNGVHNVIMVDYLFLQKFCEDLLEINNLELNKRFGCVLDDAEYISKQFMYYMGYQLNLNNPKSFNEKLQWLKLFDKNPEYVHMVDKYEVKRLVANKVGEEYIIPTLGVYDTFEEIDFGELPQQFVLKCTHDSGSVVICRDKSKFNCDEAKKVLEDGLKRNFYWVGREWPYKYVKPRIIAEKCIFDESNYELKDYKIFNFNGKAKLVQVDYDRFTQHKRNLYTIDWKYINAVIKYPTDESRKIERPRQLEKMIAISEKLSEGIPHVRTDLYCIGDIIYFGELTFYHGGGNEKFIPDDLGLILGNYLNLPKKEFNPAICVQLGK